MPGISRNKPTPWRGSDGFNIRFASPFVNAHAAAVCRRRRDPVLSCSLLRPTGLAMKSSHSAWRLFSWPFVPPRQKGADQIDGQEIIHDEQDALARGCGFFLFRRARRRRDCRRRSWGEEGRGYFRTEVQIEKTAPEGAKHRFGMCAGTGVAGGCWTAGGVRCKEFSAVSSFPL